jgi:glycosyltransferase involved in cell wall biosynthesis
MKLVILIDAWKPIVGGGQKLFREIAERLVKDHHCRLEIVTRSLKDESGEKYDKNETFFQGRLKIYRLGPCLKWSNLFGRLWFTFQSSVFCLKLKPKVFIGSTFLPALSLQLIKLFKKTPQALVVIGLGSRCFPWLEKFITQTLSYDLLITDDFNFYQKIKSKKKIKFIPNGVDLPRRQAGLPRGEAFRGLPRGTSEGKWPQFTFLFVGRNEPRKGVSVLLKAFKLVKTQFPQVKLRLFGPGFKTVTQAQLEKEFFKAHCLVLPSLWEGHPLVLFEAWAHQLPVIATDVGSVSQFLNSSNGYLVPANQVEALTQAMLKAIKNKDLAQLGQQGYQLVSKKYSWQKTVAQYYQALAELARQ